ncbi:hypothetical protein [Acinetobacter baumannii]|uniref:hypothetical protein n=2 Tax=Acinetobacter baumannii TaxID=470 RepID=UPI00112D66AD|nr:hypothetical protein [Acinetobacter baumannii]MDR0070863.1 hypothetical protein [Acinetobacter sp. 11520]MDC5357255.1 hypothetical protein [Acinetobacter baumannii]TPS15724.1 hypothetical protein FJV06_01225 [Acinetobacter baumannii]HDI2995323.1 hypothetical protein [Acinetobacter baumannii]HDI5575091.1 hypothetical protein [Acinetobacter baumannii]
MMNLYLLMEGSCTEPLVYQCWLKHLHPALNFVDNLDNITINNCYCVSSHGYPRILTNALESSIKDIVKVDKFSEFWIILDADDCTVLERKQEVFTKLSELSTIIPKYLKIKIIVQKSCIETWGLGNTKVFPTSSTDIDFQKFVSFYNVRDNDPEEMECPSDFDGTIAQYHFFYLRKMLRLKNIRYKKERPNDLDKTYYFDQLRARYQDTNHLKSFQELYDAICSLGK